MLSLARLLVVVAVLTGILALVSRFGSPILVQPDTWLEVSGLLLLFGIATALLGIGEVLQARAAAACTADKQKETAA